MRDLRSESSPLDMDCAGSVSAERVQPLSLFASCFGDIRLLRGGAVMRFGCRIEKTGGREVGELVA